MGGIAGTMEPGGSAFAPAALHRWGQRRNLLPGLALAALAAAGWAYLAYQSGSADRMAMDSAAGGAVFLAGWTAMMTAMMVPATLPLILLYRSIARRQLSPARSRIAMTALLAGYLGVWAAAGTPVYAYSLLAAAAGSLAGLPPALLLVAGGSYQFTPLKRICHARCASPLFFLLHNWRQGPAGALRLGVVHGRDCLGCCAGLMASLVALGMMNLAWTLTAAVVIFAEKTIPGSHRLARPLGVLMITGGLALLAASLLGAAAPQMKPM
jgi:predicted metal-binding membrane protein